MPEYTTYFFKVIPPIGSSISSVEGNFVVNVPGTMRQVNPFGLPTVLSDNNGAISGIGENPLADSQFEIDSSDVDFVLDASESATVLNAALAGLGPLTSQFNLAHVAIGDGVFGTWDIRVVQTDGTGAVMEHQQAGTFGGIFVGRPGDYNSNGSVDAADYVVWRDTFGQVGTGLSADGNDSQEIEAGDYAVWRSHFGQSSGGSGGLSSVALPEPMTWVMVFAVLLLSTASRSRDSSQFRL